MAHYVITYKCKPPCYNNGKCPFGKPNLLRSNQMALKLYNMIQNQVIVAGMGDIIGLNHQAIFNILDVYGITDRQQRLLLYKKILAIDAFKLKKRMEEREKQEREKNIKKRRK